MNNKEVTTLRRRLDRVRKNAAGIAMATDAMLNELGAINAVLDEMVSTNLWGERPNGDALTERPKRKAPAKPLDVDDILDIVHKAMASYTAK